MKRWAVLTVLLYALALLLLTAPVLLVAFGGWAKNGAVGLQDALKIYLNWGYWLGLAVLVAGQFLLLLLPINIAERRLPARRPLQMPILVSAFFLANLFLAGMLSLLCAIFKEGGFYPFVFLSGNTTNPSGWDSAAGAIITVLIFWLVWAVVFRRFAKSDEPCHRPPPGRLLRACRDVLGHRHRHFRHAALLRAGSVLFVRRTV